MHSPREYDFNFDDKSISLIGYSIETILAEKLRIILRICQSNLCAKAFYDVYILSKTKKFNPNVLRDAFLNTSKHRCSHKNINFFKSVILDIQSSEDL